MTKQSSAADAANSDSIQSIRSSCDRCRFHKLKCSVPSENRGSQACERCTRAKVPCVFGRRRRANRSGDEKKRPSQAATQPSRPEEAPAAMPSPPSTTASIAAVGGETTPERGQVGNGGIKKADIATAVSSAAYDSRPWEGIMADMANDCDGMHAQHGNGNALEWLQHGLGFEDTYMFDSQPLDPGLWSPQTTLLPTLIHHSSDMPNTNGDHINAHSNIPVQRILSLIADMQQRLKFLEQGPWQDNCNRNLDDYPVGTILHLSQEFGAIAGPILRTASATGSNMSSAPASDAPYADPAHGAIDTATVMLVLGGYMWLVRIYGVVLGHFQAHLGCISIAGGKIDSKDLKLAPNASPTLQLGELPSANTAPDLGRIHTALGMLLGALNEVEEQLGRGGAVARNLVVTLLTKETMPQPGYVQDECDALSGKVQSVKELLREKMGF